MFSGIVERISVLENIEKEGSNLIFTLSNPYKEPIYIDQSISHNGVCLTVVEILEGSYKVTAIDETLQKTNLGKLSIGDLINLERSTQLGARIDGHMVQGHVDCKGLVSDIKNSDGSWLISIEIPQQYESLVVDKGSICINGISLTVVEIVETTLTVAIIPYTYENTNVKQFKSGDEVNLEFDIIGKYISKYLEKIKA